MADVRVPQHVFVSYSHLDESFVEKITVDLQRDGIEIWIDKQGLQPGTPNWQKAIREAIEAAYAVLLIASPTSSQSDYVYSEIALAQKHGCPIYPIWATGDNWIDCIHLGLINYQYIDCRNENYSNGLSKIIDTLKGVMSSRLPPSFIYTAKREGNVFHIRIPPGYILLSNVPELPHGCYVAINPKAYETLQAILDELYVQYMHKRYEPYTYGKDWLISADRGLGGVALLPWNWLEGGWHSGIQSSQIWTDFFGKPFDWNIFTLSQLKVTSPTETPIEGLAVHNQLIFKAAIANPVKNVSFLLRQGIIEKVEIGEMKSPKDFEYLVLLASKLYGIAKENDEEYKGKVFVETQKLLEADEIRLLNNLIR